MTLPYEIDDEDCDVVALYDSFIKKVLRNRSRTLKKRCYRHAQYGRSVAVQLFSNRILNAQQTCEKNILLIDGVTIQIENDALYEALLTLPEQYLLVIVLTFWFEWSSNALAERFHVTDRTIRNWREKALTELQRQLKGEGRTDAFNG